MYSAQSSKKKHNLIQMIALKLNQYRIILFW